MSFVLHPSLLPCASSAVPLRPCRGGRQGAHAWRRQICPHYVLIRDIQDTVQDAKPRGGAALLQDPDPRSVNCKGRARAGEKEERREINKG